MEAADGCLFLTAQGNETSLRIEVADPRIDEPGVVLLPAQKVLAILSANSDEWLTLSVADGKAQLRSTHSKVALPTADPAAFPVFEAAPEVDGAEVNGAALVAMLRRTVMASNVDTERYALSGVFLEAEGDDVATVATDGNRISVARGKSLAPVAQRCEVLIPADSVKVLLRLLGDEAVRIAATAHAVHFVADTWDCRLRLLEGRFPNWRLFLEQREQGTCVDVPVAALSGALRQVAIATTAEHSGITVELLAVGELRLSCETSAQGEVVVTIPVPGMGRDVTLEIQHQYLVDYVRALDSNSPVTVDFVDRNSALRLAQGFGEYLAMPMGD